MAELKKPSLLVLGGTGFIGRQIVKQTANKKWSVTCVALSLPKKKNRVNKVKYYKVDLKSYNSVKKKLNKPYNYIINLAGYINHSNLSSDYNKIIREHFLAVKNIVRVVPKKSLKKFLQIGSSVEYGLAKAPQNEKTKLRPITTYALAKTKTTNYFVFCLFNNNKKQKRKNNKNKCMSQTL